MTNVARIMLSSSSSSNCPIFFLPHLINRLLLSINLSLLQMTMSGLHLTSLHRQTKPIQNCDTTKNSSRRYKNCMQILCGNATSIHQTNYVSQVAISMQCNEIV